MGPSTNVTLFGHLLLYLPEKFLKMPLAEKRSLYKCGENYVTVDKVPTWTQHYKEKIRPKHGKPLLVLVGRTGVSTLNNTQTVSGKTDCQISSAKDRHNMLCEYDK